MTIVLRTVEEGWVQATIPELPGVVTVGPARELALELLLDALTETFHDAQVTGP